MWCAPRAGLCLSKCGVVFVSCSILFLRIELRIWLMVRGYSRYWYWRIIEGRKFISNVKFISNGSSFLSPMFSLYHFSNGCSKTQKQHVEWQNDVWRPVVGWRCSFYLSSFRFCHSVLLNGWNNSWRDSRTKHAQPPELVPAPCRVVSVCIVFWVISQQYRNNISFFFH